MLTLLRFPLSFILDLVVPVIMGCLAFHISDALLHAFFGRWIWAGVAFYVTAVTDPRPEDQGSLLGGVRHILRLLFLFLIAGLTVALSCWLITLIFGDAWATPIASFLGLVVLNCVWGSLFSGPAPVLAPQHIRGAVLHTVEEARATAQALLKPKDTSFLFGGVPLAAWKACLHVFVAGATGGGKTLTFRMLAAQLLALGRANGVVYDGKLELVPYLTALLGDRPLWLFSPLDARTVAWDIGRDVRGFQEATQVAALVFPPPTENRGGGSEFYNTVGNDFLLGVVSVFTEISPGNWDLRDIIHAFRDEETLKAVLALTPAGRRRLVYFSDKRGGPDFMPTLAHKLGPLVLVAAAWEGRPKVSLRHDWDPSDGLIVLQKVPGVESSLDPLNRMLFTFAGQIVLEKPNLLPGAPEHLFLIDELGESGGLDLLPSLALLGRSKRACLAVFVQEVDSVLRLFEKRAKEFIGQFNHVVAFRSNTPSGQKWWSEVFGDAQTLHFDPSQSVSHAPDGKTTVTDGIRERTETAPIVMGSEVGDVPPATPEDGLTGYYKSPQVGTWRATLSGAEVEALIGGVADVPAFEPRTDPLELSDWTDADLVRLKLHALRRGRSPFDGLADLDGQNAAEGQPAATGTDGGGPVPPDSGDAGQHNGHARQHNGDGSGSAGGAPPLSDNGVPPAIDAAFSAQVRSKLQDLLRASRPPEPPDAAQTMGDTSAPGDASLTHHSRAADESRATDDSPATDGGLNTDGGGAVKEAGNE